MMRLASHANKDFGIKLNLFYGHDDTFCASEESLCGEGEYLKRI